MSQLATDVTNREFVGAVQNEWSAIAVEFFMDREVDQLKSRQAGKTVYVTEHVPDGPEVKVQIGPQIHTYQPMKDTGKVLMIPQIRIQKPGDNTTVIVERVREDHKQKWPNQWLYFATKEGLIDDGSQTPGWKIEEWSHINQDADSLRNLKYRRFHTVEMIAAASDAQVQQLGMGGAGLRKAAQDALRNRLKEGLSEEMEKKDKEIADMKRQMEELKALVLQKAAPQEAKTVTADTGSAPVSTPAAAPKKRGRPAGSKNKPRVLDGEQHPT